MDEIIIKAIRASKKQNRPLFIYAVAYRGMIISAVQPPHIQPHIEVNPDGHFYETTLEHKRLHIGRAA